MSRIAHRLARLAAAGLVVLGIALPASPAFAATPSPAPAPPTPAASPQAAPSTSAIPAPPSPVSTSAARSTPSPTPSLRPSFSTPPNPQSGVAAPNAAGNSCIFYPQTGFSVCGAILNHYQALGGPGGFLGYPITNELVNPDNVGRRSFFQNGTIYWSPTTGAWEIGGAIFNHWGTLGYEKGSLGYPTSDELTNPDGVGKRNTFQNGNGHIYWTPSTGAWEIGGAIFNHWGALNYEKGSLGYPTSDELTNPDGVGKRNTFQNGNGHIYWTPSTGAWEIGGAIFNKWGTLNYEKGSLGYPTSDEVNNTGTFAKYGARRNNFQHGAIYFDGGTHVGLYQAWHPPSPAAATATPPSSTTRPSRDAAVPAAAANGCPTGTTNYAPPKDPYNCLQVIVDTTGYPAGIRKGQSNHLATSVSDEDALPSGGFGLAHARDDHNVGLVQVILLLQDGIPYPSQTADPLFNRVVYSEIFVIDGTGVETISAVVQKLPDTQLLSPDRYDMGLITGYCNRGTPNAGNYQGFCPSDLPPPFGSF